MRATRSRRRLRATVWTATATVLVAVLATTVAPSASGDDVTDRKKALDAQIAQLRDDLEGTAQDLVDAAVTLKKAQAELVVVQAKVVEAGTALTAARQHDDEITARLAFAQAQEDKAQADADAGLAASARTRAALGRMAREAYTGGQLSTLSVALGATGPDQLSDRLALAGTALRAQAQVVDQLQSQQADLRATAARVRAFREQVDALKVESAAAVAARQKAQDDLAAQEKAQADLVAQEAHAVAVIQARQAAEKARLAAEQQQQAQLEAVLAARAKAALEAARRQHRSVVPSSGGGFLSYPANGPVTSGFGMRYHPILHYWRLHAGTDFGIPCGTPVYAAADGTVVRAGWSGGFGNQLVLDHGVVRGVDLGSSYNHLSRFVVTSGQVHRGQLVAYSGTTGLSTGCHLHFEVYVNGVHVNPMSWL